MSQMMNWSNMSSPFAVWAMVIFGLIFMCVIIYAAIMKKDDAKDMAGKPLEESDLLLSHEYDGIQELDNALPPWWKNLFYVTLIFGVIYMLMYHVMEIWKLPEAKYVTELQTSQEPTASTEKTGESSAPAEQGDKTKEAKLLAGKKVYMINCVACHAPDGGGAVGPNFCDEYWIHGGAKEDLVRIINEGVLEKGMISWKTLLSKEQIDDVADYILSLQGTTPANPKEPQGTKVDKS